MKKTYLANKIEVREVLYNGYRFKISSDGKYVESPDGIVKVYASKQKVRGKIFKRNLVAYKRTTFSVRRLVGLAFVGNNNFKRNHMVLGLDPTKPLNDDYRGLIWGNRSDLWMIKLGAGTAEPYTNKSNPKTKSKIPISDFWNIAKRLDNGEHACHIAKEYQTSEMAIRRIRGRYCRNRTICFGTKDLYKQEILLGLDPYLSESKKHTKKRYAKLNGIRYETLWKWEKRIDEIIFANFESC